VSDARQGPGRHGAVDPEVSLDEALRQFGEDLLNEPIPQRLLQALDFKGREVVDQQKQGSQPSCLHTPFRAPPTAGGLRFAPLHAGSGATEFFSRPVRSKSS
jgi:hypothetical protein